MNIQHLRKQIAGLQAAIQEKQREIKNYQFEINRLSFLLDELEQEAEKERSEARYDAFRMV